MIQVKQITHKGGNQPTDHRLYGHGFSLKGDLCLPTKNKILPENILIW